MAFILPFVGAMDHAHGVRSEQVQTEENEYVGKMRGKKAQGVSAGRAECAGGLSSGRFQRLGARWPAVE